MKTIIFDLETTSDNIQECEIIQFAAVVLTDNDPKTAEVCMFYVKPSGEISKQAVEVHGLTYVKLKDEPVWADVAPKVWALFHQCDIISGYNIMRFDMPVLLRQLEEAKCYLDVDGKQFVDTYLGYVDEFPRDLEAAFGEYIKPRPSEQYGYDELIDNVYGKDLKGELYKPHDALFDSIRSTSVLLAQIERRQGGLEELADLSKPETFVDFQGKLRRIDGKICWGFGKHKGKELKKDDGVMQGYATWSLKQNYISGETKKIIRDIFGWTDDK